MSDLYRLARDFLNRVNVDRPELATLPITAVVARLNPCRHGPDFASVVWFDTPYQFSATQSHAVKLLWEAWENGTPDVRQETLLEATGSDSGKLANTFKDHPAWGTLIVSRTKGTYRLAEPV